MLSKRSGKGATGAAEAATTSTEQMDWTYPFKIVGAVGVIFALVYAVFAYGTGTPGEDDVVSRLVRWARAKWSGVKDDSGSGKGGAAGAGKTKDEAESPKGSVRFIKPKPKPKPKPKSKNQTRIDDHKKEDDEEEPKPTQSCYVGEERGLRTCVPVDEAAQCMSGDIFPSERQCVNPNMRYVGERS